MDGLEKAINSLIIRDIRNGGQWGSQFLHMENDAREYQLICLFIAVFVVPWIGYCIYMPLYWMGLLMPIGFNLHSAFMLIIIPFIIGIGNGSIFGRLAYRKEDVRDE